MRPITAAEDESSRRDPDVERDDSGQPGQARSGPVSDEVLAQSAIADRAAFIELYRRYVDSVYSYFSWKLGRAVAEDLVSDTFERALMTLNRFDARRRWRPWLFGIARHVSREHARRHQREPVTTGEPVDPVAESPGPEQAALEDERVAFARKLSPPSPKATARLSNCGSGRTFPTARSER